MRSGGPVEDTEAVGDRPAGTGGRRWRSPVLTTLRLLPAAGRGLTAAVGMLVVFSALLPGAFAVAGGALVGSIGGAAADGWGSAAGHRLIGGILAVVVLFMLQQVAGPALWSLSDALGRRLEGRLRARVMTSTMGPAGIAHLEDPDVVDLVADAQSLGTGRSTVKDGVVGLAAVTATTLAGFVAAVVLAAYRWWLAAGLLGLHVAVTWLLAGQLHQTVEALRGNVRRFRRSSYFRDLALGTAAAKELRVFGLASWVGERFAEQWRLAMAAFWREERRARWLPPAGALVLAAGQGVTYAMLARSAVRGEISIGALSTYAGAATGVAAVFSIGMDTLNIGYGTAPVPAVLKLERVLAEPRFQLGGARAVDGMPASGIRFEGVAFHYPGRADDVFHQLDLEIPAGRSLAVVGVNGAGKTTMVKLLARLYDPTGGHITVDGVDLAELDPRAWQRRVAAIFQDFARYQLSAADNVGLGAVEHMGDRRAVRAAAARAGADQLVEGLASGWDTVLSRRTPGGTELSGGEWHRVALARALFAVDAGASVLVLDEPTAALDVRAEAAFYDRFLDVTRGVTTIVISHRFSTVRRADRIAVLQGGRVAEIGDHESLMAADGRYAQMFRMQATHFSTDAPEVPGG